MRDTGENSQVTRFCLLSSRCAFLDILDLLTMQSPLYRNSRMEKSLPRKFSSPKKAGIRPVKRMPVSQTELSPSLSGIKKGGAGLYPDEEAVLGYRRDRRQTRIAYFISRPSKSYTLPL